MIIFRRAGRVSLDYLISFWFCTMWDSDIERQEQRCDRETLDKTERSGGETRWISIWVIPQILKIKVCKCLVKRRGWSIAKPIRNKCPISPQVFEARKNLRKWSPRPPLTKKKLQVTNKSPTIRNRGPPRLLRQQTWLHFSREKEFQWHNGTSSQTRTHSQHAGLRHIHYY